MDDGGAFWPDHDDRSNGGESNDGCALLPETRYCHVETQRLGSRNQVFLSVISADALSDARVASGLQRAYIF